jgi:O-antigen/teichoic acid export membrane protein
MSLRNQYLRNSITTFTWLFSTILVGLVLPPILVNTIGFSQYGIWALIVLINSYASLLEMGLSAGFIKLIAEANVEDDHRKCNSYINSLLWFYLVIVFLAIVFLAIFGELIAKIFLNSVNGWEKYTPIFFVYAIVSLVGLLSVPFSGLLKGLQRFDLGNYIEIVASIISALVTIIFLLLDYGLWALVLGALLAALFRQIAYVFSSMKKYRYYRFEIVGRADINNFWKIAHLGKAELSVKISAVISQSVIRLGISHYSGIEFVGIYDIARRVVIQINGLSTIVFYPLVPAISDLAAKESYKQINHLLKKNYQFLAMIVLPITLFILLFASPVYGAWLRIPDMTWISFTGRVLSIATLFEILTGPSLNTALGLGNPNLHLVTVSTSLFLKIILVFIGGKFWGYPAIVIGETTAAIVASLICLYYFQRWHGISVIRMVLNFLIKVGSISTVVWLPPFIIWLMYADSPYWNGLLVWIGIFIIGICLHILLYRVTELLTKNEINQVISLFPVKRDKKPI